MLLEETKRAIREMVCEQIEEANREGLIRYGTDRHVTFKQEMAYRLCHQDFFGLSTEDTSEVMGLTPREVERLLKRLREQAGQLFPILTPRTAKIHAMFLDGYTVSEIADYLNIYASRVWKVLRYLHEHREQTGIYFRSDAGRRISYQPSMDASVKEIF